MFSGAAPIDSPVPDSLQARPASEQDKKGIEPLDNEAAGPSQEDVVAATQAWLERAVIGLNLCPFAKAVHVSNRVRYVVSNATTEDALVEELSRELARLHESNPDEIETTLLIHPYVFGDFLEFNDYLDVVDATIAELGLEGEIQVASFHPDYQFAGTAPEDVENCTNRSPYPTLHLLREASIERAVEAFGDTDAIFERNIETLRRLGAEGWRRLARRPGS
jgi:hypothetical protein